MDTAPEPVDMVALEARVAALEATLNLLIAQVADVVKATTTLTLWARGES